ncbi:single strand DNA binding protein [Maribacter phage Panino]
MDKFLQYNKVGDEVEVSFNLQSREYNNKIYTTAQAWKVWNNSGNSNSAPAPEEDGDDLPF